MPLALASVVRAQPAETPVAETKPEPSAAIPIVSIAVAAATLDGLLRNVEPDLTMQPALVSIDEELPALDARILSLSKRTNGHLERGYDRGDLDSLDAAWRSNATELSAWESVLGRRLDDLDTLGSELIHREEIWEATRAGALAEQAPADVRSQISEAQAALKKARRNLRASRDRTLGLQKRVVALQGRVAGELDSLTTAREQVLIHVLNRNDPPIWQWTAGDLEENRERSTDALLEARDSISTYFARNRQLSSLHLALTAVLVWVSWIARRWLTRPPLDGTVPIPGALAHPVGAGLLLGLCATMWIHGDAPPKLGWLLSTVALPFWFAVQRALLPRTLRLPLTGLVILILLDFSRRLLMDFDALSSLLLAVEAALATVGLLLLRRPEQLARVPRPESLFWVRILGGWLHFTLFGAAISLAGALLGWTSLADLMLSATVIGTFVGSLLFTASLIVEAIAAVSIASGKLDGIRILSNHHRTFQRILSRIVRTVAFVTWVLFVLGSFTIQEATLNALRATLAAPVGYGGFQITLGGLLAFGIAIWASWLLSRFLSAILEDEVFTRISLPRGVPFALSTLTRYTILVLGFIAAVAALGFEVGNLALVVCALGVGIGFGMQNMVNNFISGLILLFERPIKVGDLVSLDPLLGNVKRIGIRSSTIRTFDGADVIVPNGDLISNQVTNWTLADTRRRIILPVGVTYGTPARRVIELLEATAQEHPDVMESPAPYGLFTGFGDSSLDFELRAWTESEDALTIVRSDLAVAVQDALAAAGIQVPFPQRDLHVKTLPDPPAES
jgi:potassium efflux system protein